MIQITPRVYAQPLWLQKLRGVHVSGTVCCLAYEDCVSATNILDIFLWISEYLITDCYWAGIRSGTRSAGRQMLEVVRMNTSFGDRSFAAAAPRVWNGLPDVVRNSALSEDAFAKLLKTYLMNCM